MLQKAGINVKAPPSDYGDEAYDRVSQMSTHGGAIANIGKKNKEGVINLTPSKGLFSRYKDFLKMPQYSLDKVRIYGYLNLKQPSIRNASPYVGDEWEHYRQKDLESKKKWIDKSKDFKTMFGTATTNNEKNFIKNYVTATPSNPPMLHQFREPGPK